MTYSKVVNVYGSSYAYGSKADVINQNWKWKYFEKTELQNFAMLLSFTNVYEF